MKFSMYLNRRVFVMQAVSVLQFRISYGFCFDFAIYIIGTLTIRRYHNIILVFLQFVRNNSYPLLPAYSNKHSRKVVGYEFY